MSGELKHIPLSQIRENPNALRSVDKTKDKYEGLVDSIRRDGVLNPILVRECEDPTTKESFFGLVDGLHRFTASKDAGLTEIPAYVRNMEDSRVLEAQILANLHKVETKPIEYSKQLLRMLTQNPVLTLSELAARLSKSPAWLNDRLSLTKLKPELAALVDEGKVVLSNAYALSKLPHEEQVGFLDRAMTMSPPEFIPTVNAHVKELRDAKRQGRDPKAAEFVPQPYLRKVGEVKDEYESNSVGRELIAKYNLTEPQQVWAMAVKWALNMDPDTVELAKAKDEQRKKEKVEESERRKKERAEQREREAREKAASLETL